jgi:hypothetical protein
LKSDIEFTIQYEISAVKIIREIEKYNKKKKNKFGVETPRHNPYLLRIK